MSKQERCVVAKNMNIVDPSSNSTAFCNFCREIFPDAQFLQSDLVLQRETFLVGQVQEADEAIRRGDVRHGLFRIDLLEVVHDRCKLQHLLLLFGRGVDRRRFPRSRIVL